jgi:viroplasmin and RNaseH domain-containing protein
LSNRSKSVTQSTTTNNIATTATNKHSYYKKSCYATQQQQPKPKMSNSLEFLAGPIADIQKKYEILSDIVTEVNGKVHGSQSHFNGNNSLSLIVYYEVPAEGNKREEVKRKFSNSIVTILNK